MALKDYGVLKGKVIDGMRETDPNSPHYQIHIQAGNAHYRVAVNVKSQTSPSDLLFLVNENFNHPILSRLAGVTAGFSPLPSKPNSGALDFIRGNLFSPKDMRPLPPNLPGQDNDLNDKIEHFATRAKGDAAAEVFAIGTKWGPENIADKIFHFKPGQGVHNIHMNQGNSPAFMQDDGVWQDGGLLFHFPGMNQWVAVFLAFQSQSWHTDDKTGHAIPDAPPAGPGGGTEGILKIVGAMVNPTGPEKESVILLNLSPAPLNLNGWSIADKLKHKCPLSGVIPAGSPLIVPVQLPVQFGNKGGTITLLDPKGLKVDGVAYTAEQASREGWVIAF